MFMYQLCKSIYHMHRNGIFHRDVKPENILVKVSVMQGEQVILSAYVRNTMSLVRLLGEQKYHEPRLLIEIQCVAAMLSRIPMCQLHAMERTYIIPCKGIWAMEHACGDVVYT